jgi:hypothetical protein
MIATAIRLITHFVGEKIGINTFCALRLLARQLVTPWFLRPSSAVAGY